MTENNNSTEEYSAKVIEALIRVLESETTPEMTQARAIMLRRLALAGDVVPSRIPAPQNITEIGGYFNLLEMLNEPELRAQVLASILGVAGPNPPLGFYPTAPLLFFTSRQNDRPEGPQQAAIPVNFHIRSDFAQPFDAALQTIHAHGCQLPILSSPNTLPPVSPLSGQPGDLLRYIGRTLDLVPAAALLDPDADPLALARLVAGGGLQVVARQLDDTAPSSGAVNTESWGAWQCNETTCQETIADRTYLPLTPILNAAGWYQGTLTTPVSLRNQGTWSRWVNVTGLVAGVTHYGDELSLLYRQEQITASAVREQLEWVWDGTAFSEPGG